MRRVIINHKQEVQKLSPLKSVHEYRPDDNLLSSQNEIVTRVGDVVEVLYQTEHTLMRDLVGNRTLLKITEDLRDELVVGMRLKIYRTDGRVHYRAGIEKRDIALATLAYMMDHNKLKEAIFAADCKLVWTAIVGAYTRENYAAIVVGGVPRE